MKEVEMDDYLGDVVANQGNMKMNIKKRVSKGFGVISQVMTILEKLSLGYHYFKIAMILRNSIFISSLLVNVEVWYPISEKDVEELEKLDRILLKRILGTG